MGAKTGLAGVFTGLLILCTLLFLTPLFNNLPNTVLGAIVIAACIKLFDYSEAVHLLRTNFRDFLLWMAAFIGTIFLGIEIGVAIAVGLSLVFVIYESANPHMAILGRLPRTAVYRNVKQYPDAITHPGILIIRIDAPMYYANISYIKDKLRHYLVSSLHPPQRSESTPDLETGAAPSDWPFPKTEDEEATPGGSPVRYLILDMTPVTYVDSTAVHTLKDLHQEYSQQGLHLALSNTNKRVMVTLARTGFLQRLGPEWHFVRAHDAVQVCLSHLRADGLRTSSPPSDQPIGDAETEDTAEHETEAERRIEERENVDGINKDGHTELGELRDERKD
ncbi:protein with STAS (Sulphate Transporter and AntiSigma factor antagonist) domain [Klebsormidium nitens]|uniref:Protein with STAS (Sulphate Transporter and AntiSigma factor antagonist) domain n=1 Tax=Klebsormidium nitens TaxID=105231 RepID=A0A1Y1I0F8_KLENI|nr:protein with STAS (Sulphate Transporter and AntiSigma factor antagonist) domain [Klebsormidium nitens]|eukprot:GAQ82256.1 protein with STAS (Sulphate Transporter and AntiSigma factor antagonist) domain [Klebsormidium nitens]